MIVLSLVLLTHAMHSRNDFGWCLEQVVSVEVNTVLSEIAVMVAVVSCMLGTSVFAQTLSSSS